MVAAASEARQWKPSHKVKQPEGGLSPSSSSKYSVGAGPPSARKQSAQSNLMNAVATGLWPVTVSKMLSHQGDGPQGRGYRGYSSINPFRRRRVCSAAAAALVRAARHVDYRPKRLWRSPRRLVWPPTWLSSPPQVERDVPAKDSVFSSAS